MGKHQALALVVQAHACDARPSCARHFREEVTLRGLHVVHQDDAHLVLKGDFEEFVQSFGDFLLAFVESYLWEAEMLAECVEYDYFDLAKGLLKILIEPIMEGSLDPLIQQPHMPYLLQYTVYREFFLVFLN